MRKSEEKGGGGDGGWGGGGEKKKGGGGGEKGGEEKGGKKKKEGGVRIDGRKEGRKRMDQCTRKWVKCFIDGGKFDRVCKYVDAFMD